MSTPFLPLPHPIRLLFAADMGYFDLALSGSQHCASPRELVSPLSVNRMPNAVHIHVGGSLYVSTQQVYWTILCLVHSESWLLKSI